MIHQELDHMALCSWGWQLSVMLQQPNKLSFGELLKAPYFGCLQDFWIHKVCNTQAPSCGHCRPWVRHIAAADLWSSSSVVHAYISENPIGQAADSAKVAQSWVC